MSLTDTNNSRHICSALSRVEGPRSRGLGGAASGLAGPRELRFCRPHEGTGPTAAAGIASSVLCLPVATMWCHKGLPVPLVEGSVTLTKCSCPEHPKKVHCRLQLLTGQSVTAGASLRPTYHCPSVSPSPLLPLPSCMVCFS